MLCGETVAVCWKNLVKNVNVLCGQNIEHLMLNRAARLVVLTTRLSRINIKAYARIGASVFPVVFHY
jgi:hypothetical protein